MLKTIDFDDLMMKPLLFGLITQTILPVNEDTLSIAKNDVINISFNNVDFRDYNLLVDNVSFTSLSKLTNKDISKNGFLYKKAFYKFIGEFRNIKSDTGSIVKIDFSLVECET